MLSDKLNSWLKSSINLALTLVICGLFFISNANPVQAVTSNVRDGEVSLNKIQDKTDDVAAAQPLGIDEITKESQQGLNAVQGGADKEKMISSEDTDATTIKEKASNFFDNLTN